MDAFVCVDVWGTSGEMTKLYMYNGSGKMVLWHLKRGVLGKEPQSARREAYTLTKSQVKL